MLVRTYKVPTSFSGHATVKSAASHLSCAPPCPLRQLLPVSVLLLLVPLLLVALKTVLTVLDAKLSQRKADIVIRVSAG